MREPKLAERLESLARLQPGPLPLLSLYLNTTRGDTGRPHHDVFLRKALPEVVTAHAESTLERQSLESDVRRIGRYVDQELKPSTRGLAIFACGGADLFEAVQLDVPFDRHQLVVGDRPHVYPLARMHDQYPLCAAVLADSNLARLFVFAEGTTLGYEEIQHSKTRQTQTGGWSQARLQRHRDDLHLHHVKDVVKRLDALVAAHRIERVVVAGDDVIVPQIEEQMPEPLARKVVDRLRLEIRTPDHEVFEATMAAVRRNDEQADEVVVGDLVGEFRAAGRAVVELKGVLAALNAGQVDTLVITADPERLEGADETANEMVTLAKQTSATVRFIENPALLAGVGGVGASLRYRA